MYQSIPDRPSFSSLCCFSGFIRWIASCIRMVVRKLFFPLLNRGKSPPFPVLLLLAVLLGSGRAEGRFLFSSSSSWQFDRDLSFFAARYSDFSWLPTTTPLFFRMFAAEFILRSIVILLPHVPPMAIAGLSWPLSILPRAKVFLLGIAQRPFFPPFLSPPHPGPFCFGAGVFFLSREVGWVWDSYLAHESAGTCHQGFFFRVLSLSPFFPLLFGGVFGKNPPKNPLFFVCPCLPFLGGRSDSLSLLPCSTDYFLPSFIRSDRDQHRLT